jgi:hypothetical protein
MTQIKSFLMLAPNCDLIGVVPREPRSESSSSSPSPFSLPFPLTGVEKIFFAALATSVSAPSPTAAFVADADDADAAPAGLGVLEGVLGLWSGLEARVFAAEGLLKT